MFFLKKSFLAGIVVVDATRHDEYFAFLGLRLHRGILRGANLNSLVVFAQEMGS